MPPEAGGVLTATSVPQAAVSELDDLSAAVQKDRLLSRQRKELAQLQEKNKRIISPCQGIAS